MNYNKGKFYPRIKINDVYIFLVEKEQAYFFEGNNFKYKELGITESIDNIEEYTKGGRDASKQIANLLNQLNLEE
jgi:hypothetical protein